MVIKSMVKVQYGTMVVIYGLVQPLQMKMYLQVIYI